MHTHDELPVRPVDLRSGHHFTSTYPASHFRHMLILTKHLDGRPRRRHPRDRRPYAARAAPTEHRALREGELRELLDELAVPLTDDERAALDVRVRGVAPRSPERPHPQAGRSGWRGAEVDA